jgi:hypothetical protein
VVVWGAGAAGAGALCSADPDASGDAVDDDVPADLAFCVGAGSGLGAERAPAAGAARPVPEGYGSGAGPVAALACAAARAASVSTAEPTAMRLRAVACAGDDMRARTSESRRSRNVISARTSPPARFFRLSSTLLPVVRQVNTRGARPPAPRAGGLALVSLRQSIDRVTYLSAWLLD